MTENTAYIRKCPACGCSSNHDHTIKWDPSAFVLRITCYGCGAAWQERPQELWRLGDLGGMLCTIEAAANAKGVTPRTVRRWLKARKFKTVFYVSGLKNPLLLWAEIKAL